MFDPITIPTNNKDITPLDLGVPHEKWMSPGQREGYFILERAFEESKFERKFLVMEGPTGTGKTVWAAAAATFDRVTYLAHTHGLLDQAERSYDFTPLKGKHVYDCVLPEKVSEWASRRKTPTAYDCHFSKMRECDYAAECPYLIALDEAASAHTLSCTPQMALFNHKIRERSGILIVDECHALVESILGYVDFTISQPEIDTFGFSPYPFPDGVGELKKGVRNGQEMTVDMQLKIIAWLDDCKAIASRMEMGGNPLAPATAQAKREREKLERIMQSIPASDWFLRTGPGIIEHYDYSSRRYRSVGGVVLKPLTAGGFANMLWGNKQLVVFMSATVGDPAPLMQQLGIDDYEYHSFPHPVPVAARQITNLRNKRMTHTELTKDPNLYMIQAAKIARWINGLPSHYRGVVLTSSYTKIKKLNEFMPKFLRDPDRIWTPPKAAIGDRVAAFVEDEKPGLIWIETLQGAGEGFDGRGHILRFVVVAGLAHPNPTDAYVRARKRTSTAYMTAKVFNEVMQACGRASRSEHRNFMTEDEIASFDPDEFTEDGYLISYAAVADGSAFTGMGMRNYSPWFREAIAE